MPIQFYCPECHRPLTIGTRKAGCRIAGPVCNKDVDVPSKSEFRRRTRLDEAGPQTDERFLTALAIESVVDEPTPPPPSGKQADFAQPAPVVAGGPPLSACVPCPRHGPFLAAFLITLFVSAAVLAVV